LDSCTRYVVEKLASCVEGTLSFLPQGLYDSCSINYGPTADYVTISVREGESTSGILTSGAHANPAITLRYEISLDFDRWYYYGADLIDDFTIQTQNGILSLQPDGNYTYQQISQNPTSDAIYYRVCEVNGDGLCSSEYAVVVDIEAVNDVPTFDGPPTLVNSLTNATVTEIKAGPGDGSGSTGYLLCKPPRIIDVDTAYEHYLSITSYEWVDADTGQGLSGGDYFYYPSPADVGRRISCTVTAFDLIGYSAPSPLSPPVLILPPPPPFNYGPSADYVTISVNEGENTSGVLTSGFHENPLTTLRYELSTNLEYWYNNEVSLIDPFTIQSYYGILSLQPDGSYTYQVTSQNPIVDAVYYRVCEVNGDGLCSSEYAIIVEIEAVNDAPSFSEKPKLLDSNYLPITEIAAWPDNGSGSYLICMAPGITDPDSSGYEQWKSYLWIDADSGEVLSSEDSSFYLSYYSPKSAHVGRLISCVVEAWDFIDSSRSDPSIPVLILPPPPPFNNGPTADYVTIRVKEGENTSGVLTSGFHENPLTTLRYELSTNLEYWYNNEVSLIDPFTIQSYYGIFSLQPDGTYTYQATSQNPTVDAVYYRVCEVNGDGLCSSDYAIGIEIEAVNDAPSFSEKPKLLDLNYLPITEIAARPDYEIASYVICMAPEITDPDSSGYEQWKSYLWIDADSGEVLASEESSFYLSYYSPKLAHVGKRISCVVEAWDFIDSSRSDPSDPVSVVLGQ
jgi:VCBS repeat-containing protein